MDTLGGPANFRSNYRIRSRCGRRFIGHVDGQATYKLRFLFYPYGQPDLSLFLIRIPRLSFFSSSSITNLYRLFSKKQPFNGSRFLRNAYNIFRILIFLSLFISDFDINKNSLEKFETGEEIQFLSNPRNAFEGRAPLSRMGEKESGGRREGPESSRKIFIPSPTYPILSLSPKRLLSNFLRVWRQSGEKLVDLWVPSGLFLPSFSRRHPAVVLLPSICGSIRPGKKRGGPVDKGILGWDEVSGRPQLSVMIASRGPF